MPYSERQRALLQAMGLVPWVDKHALTPGASDPVLEAADTKAHTTVDTASDSAGNAYKTTNSEAAVGSRKVFLLETVFRGNKAFLHPGSDAASVLIVMEQSAVTTGGDLQLPPEQERLLTDMLKAIQLDNQHVVRALMADEGSVPVEMNQDLGPALTPSIQSVIRLVLSTAETQSDSEQESRWALPGTELPAWNLPHPVRILEQPVLKRRAWNVLKAVKSAVQTRTAQ